MSYQYENGGYTPKADVLTKFKFEEEDEKDINQNKKKSYYNSANKEYDIDSMYGNTERGAPTPSRRPPVPYPRHTGGSYNRPKRMVVKSSSGLNEYSLNGDHPADSSFEYLQANADLSPNGTDSGIGTNQRKEQSESPYVNIGYKHSHQPSYEVQAITRGRPLGSQDTYDSRYSRDTQDQSTTSSNPDPANSSDEKQGSYRVQDYGEQGPNHLSYRDKWEHNRLVRKNRQLSPSDPNRVTSPSAVSQTSRYGDMNRSNMSHTSGYGDMNRSNLSQTSRYGDFNRSSASRTLDQSGLSRASRDSTFSRTPDSHQFSRTPDANTTFKSDYSPPDLNKSNTKSLTSFHEPDLLQRSVMSGEYRVSEPTRVVRTEVEPNKINRDYTADQSFNASLTRDPITHRKIPVHQQNGNLKSKDNPLDQSKRSIALSNLDLNRLSKFTLYGKDYAVENSLVNLSLLAVLSIILSTLGLQVVFRLNGRVASNVPNHSSILTNESYANVLEVAVALSTFVVMLDLCCLMVCAMQVYFAAKLLKCPYGEQRSFKYLKECAGTRFIAVCGFFVSIPTFFLALLLYILMEYRATPAIISTVIMTIGITFTIATMCHSFYFWRVEKNQADMNIEPYDRKKSSPTGESTMSQSELSTLV